MGSEATEQRKAQRQRAKLRARLVARGASQAVVARELEKLREDERAAVASAGDVNELRRWRELVARVGEQEAARIVYASAAEQPSDRGYRPTSGDPLLRGAGRAQGDTARAVARRKATTKWELDEQRSRAAR